MKDEESWYATDTLHISRQWTAEEASSQDSSSVSLLTTANSFLLQATNSINSFFLLLLHNHVSTVLIHAEAVIVCFCRWLNPVKIAPRKQWIPNRALPTLYFIFSLKLSSVKTAEEGRVHLSFSTLPSRRRRRPSGHYCGPTSRTKRVGGGRQNKVLTEMGKKVTTDCPATLRILHCYQKQDLRQLNSSSGPVGTLM